MPRPSQAAATADTTAVLIGRFQPFHHGHMALLERALSEAARVVVVMGSAMQARSPKNPFTWEERAAMVRGAAGEQAHRLHFLPMRDYYDDARWVKAVVAGVHAVAGKGTQITLVGHDKDATSYYLNRFSAPVRRSSPTDRTGPPRARRARRRASPGQCPPACQ